MFRISFVILAMASALALNGCSQCTNTQDTAPTTETAPEEAAPIEGMTGDESAPAEGAEMAPEAEPTPEEGAAE